MTKKRIRGSRDGNPFESRVQDTVVHHNMFSGGESIVVGVSGGPDSVALLRVLEILAAPFDLTLCLAHVNHCLRGAESDRDEAFVRRLAASRGLIIHVEKRDVAAVARKEKLSIETAARQVRYAFYRSLAACGGYDRIALGHNSDDNAEQVLMNLLRGSGPRGLTGIPPVREDLFIRPLIRTTRQEILDYLATCGQSWVQDSSNRDRRFLRNRVRHGLLPLLKSDYNPGIHDALNRLSHILAGEEAWMETETRAVAHRCMVRMNDHEVRLDRSTFDPLHPALARRLVRLAIQSVKGDLRRISWGHVADVLDLIAAGSPGKRLDLPGRIRITLTKGAVFFTRSAISLRRLPSLRR